MPTVPYRRKVKREHLRGCPNLKPSRKQLPGHDRAYAQVNAYVLPDVAAARCEDLMRAGWGAHSRAQIPADWRTRRPHERKPGSGVTSKPAGASDTVTRPEKTLQGEKTA